MQMHPLTMRVVKLALERLLEERPMLRPDFVHAAEVEVQRLNQMLEATAKDELTRVTKAIAEHERRRTYWLEKEGGTA